MAAMLAEPAVAFCSLSFISFFVQGAYNYGKPGKLREFFNSGKFRETQGILNLLREFL